MAPEQVADAVERLAPQRLAVAFQLEKLGGPRCRGGASGWCPRSLVGWTILATISAVAMRPSRPLMPQIVEDVGEAEIVEGLEAQALAADGARGSRAPGYRGPTVATSGLRASSCIASTRNPPGPELGDNVLGCGLHVRRGFEQGRAAVEQRLGESSNFAPFLLRHRIVGTEVEKRALPDLVADALREHEAMAADRLAFGGVGLGCPDEHVARHVLRRGGSRYVGFGGGVKGNLPQSTISWHYQSTFRASIANIAAWPPRQRYIRYVHRKKLAKSALGKREKVPTWGEALRRYAAKQWSLGIFLSRKVAECDSFEEFQYPPSVATETVEGIQRRGLVANMGAWRMTYSHPGVIDDLFSKDDLSCEDTRPRQEEEWPAVCALW